MKTRNGFVSNSSSSSFVVIKKEKSMSEEEIIKVSMERHTQWGGEEYAFDKKKYIEALAKNGERVILNESVEYGAEESVEKVVKALLSHLGILEQVRCEWEE